MPSPRKRSYVAALAMTVAFSPLGGCAGEPPANEPGRDDVPSTLEPRPTPRPQPEIELVISPPSWTLNGYAASSGRRVWDQSMDLVRNWLLHPPLVMEHLVKPGELDGIAQLMTPEAARIWRSAARRAIEGRRNPSGAEKRRPRAEGIVNQLVFWDVRLSSGRGWDNPMFTPARISNGQVLGGDDVMVIFTLDASLRLRGRGLQYEVPFSTTLSLVWTKVGDHWKLRTWSRSVKVRKERLVGPPEAVASSESAKAATRSAQPEPQGSGEPRPSVVNSAP